MHFGDLDSRLQGLRPSIKFQIPFGIRPTVKLEASQQRRIVRTGEGEWRYHLSLF